MRRELRDQGDGAVHARDDRPVAGEHVLGQQVGQGNERRLSRLAAEIVRLHRGDATCRPGKIRQTGGKAQGVFFSTRPRPRVPGMTGLHMSGAG